MYVCTYVYVCMYSGSALSHCTAYLFVPKLFAESGMKTLDKLSECWRLIRMLDASTDHGDATDRNIHQLF